MKIEEIMKLGEQSQKEFIDRLVDVNLIGEDDNDSKSVVAIFLRKYTEDICDLFEILVEQKAEELANEDDRA